MEGLLGRFQGDLGQVSEEIRTLQVREERMMVMSDTSSVEGSAGKQGGWEAALRQTGSGGRGRGADSQRGMPPMLGAGLVGHVSRGAGVPRHSHTTPAHPHPPLGPSPTHHHRPPPPAQPTGAICEHVDQAAQQARG
jgi:hypothetical protein